MLAVELANFFIAAGFEDADLVDFGFVVGAGDTFDEIDGLVDVFDTERGGDSNQKREDEADGLADAAGLFADNEFVGAKQQETEQD